MNQERVPKDDGLCLTYRYIDLLSRDVQTLGSVLIKHVFAVIDH